MHHTHLQRIIRGTVTLLVGAVTMSVLANASVGGIAGAASGDRPASSDGSLATAAANGPLAGYAVVNSGPLPAAYGSQDLGSVSCPVNTVVYGGGVLLASDSLDANVNSSWPTNNGWSAYVNNASSASTTFTVYAVCGAAPAGYAVIGSNAVDNPAHSQTIASATCPKGTDVLSGGGLSNTESLEANLSSSLPAATMRPLRNGWFVIMNNAGSDDAKVTPWAICGRPKGYTIKMGARVIAPAGNERLTAAKCPSGTVPFGGGVFSNSLSVDTDINSTFPDPDAVAGWGVYENNGATSAQSMHAYAICAK